MNEFELAKKIIEASNVYYGTGNPLVPDHVFNSWIEELREINSSHPVLLSPGWGCNIINHLNKFNHSFLVEGFDTKLQSVTYDPSVLDDSTSVESSKLDGLAGVAYYDEGKLRHVLTRNDGQVGLDITNNLSLIKMFPKVISKHIEWVKGEVVTTWDATKKYGYSHPRNMACGLANSNELDEAHSELSFVVYASSNDELDIVGRLEELRTEGFEVVRYSVINNSNEFNECLNQYDYSKPNYVAYKYPTDGSIITDIDGNNGYAIKFPTPIVQVKVVGVVLQLSDRGRINPVIEIEPVELSGATITYCSGFNMDSIRVYGIGEGAIIELTRANEVIPHWVNTIKSVDPVIPTEFEGKPTYWYGAHLMIDVDTTESSISTLLSWRAPDGVGNAKIMTLIEQYDITSFSQLAYIASMSVDHAEFLDEMHDVFSDTYYDRMVDLLRGVHNGFTLAHLLESTYTRGLGATASDTIMKYYNNDPIALYGTLVEQEELPRELQNKLPTYLANEGIYRNKKVIIELLTSGINIIEPEPEVDTSQAISICLTGKLSKSRGELLLEWGNKVVEVDVSKAQYLITDNPSSGSSKNKAASKLMIPIISEEQFRFAILGEVR